MTQSHADHEHRAHDAHGPHDAHGRSHDGHSHDGHVHTRHVSSSALGWSLLIVLGFGFVEVVVGFLSGSLALVSDGVHMLTDSAALGIAWIARWVARREAGPRMSFGYGRAEPLAAMLNAVFYLAVLVFIVVEAFGRLRAPTSIDVEIALPVAIVGMAVNAGVWHLLHGQRHDHNVRGALLHVIGDFAGSAIAITALVTVWFTGWTLIDPILTLAICVLLLVATARLLRDSGRVLMNAAPAGVDPARVEATLRAPAGVRSVHDLHLWSLGDGRPALSAHVGIDDIAQWPRILAEIRASMDEIHGIDHLTLQPEATADETLLQLQERLCRRRP